MRPVDYAALTERRCCKCKRILPVSAFNRYTDATAKLTGWRYYSRCIECNRADCRRYGADNKPRRNERLRTWRRKNPDAARQKSRRARLKSLYGLTERQAATLFAVAGGCCWICGRRPTRLAIDHCHRTGRVRGALCPSCNSFLGRVEANPKILARMRNYLNQTCHADVLLEVANGG